MQAIIYYQKTKGGQLIKENINDWLNEFSKIDNIRKNSFLLWVQIVTKANKKRLIMLWRNNKLKFFNKHLIHN